MPCYYPSIIPHPKFGIPMQVPCGKCLGCRLERSRQWGVRIMHEVKCHDISYFLTLTYSDEHLPENGTLVKKHVQDFIKRYRKSIEPIKISYFHCGEYGGDKDRPHYHLIIFGHRPSDTKYLRQSQSGEALFRSDKLEKLWGFGFANIGTVTFESACYVARYCVDKLTGDLGEQVYTATGRIPPYATMSTKPAIGKRFYEKFKSDIYPHDEVIVNGKSCKPPKYYDKLLKEKDPILYQKLARGRVQRAMDSPDFNDLGRLRIKEEVKKSKIQKLKRNNI